jgi:lysophospholipase L1-like esterase
MEPGVAYIGVRGGGCGHVPEAAKSKNAVTRAAVERIIVIVGGNDLSVKKLGVISPSPLGVRGVREKLERLVRDLQLWMPNAWVNTADIIPRRSNGFFNSRVRAIGQYIEQQGRHHYISLHKNFYIDARTKTTERYCILDSLYSGDGVHLNDVGYGVLRRVCEWLIEGGRGVGERLDFSVAGRVVTIRMKF